MLRVPVTEEVSETTTSEMERQPFEKPGTLAKLKATVPVYPATGVTVTVVLPEPPDATVVLDEVIRNPFSPTTTVSAPSEAA